MVLQEQRQLTHENVQRKQARTGEEREEDDEEQASESESEDEDNEIIYNPKNLPLGWDGKVSTDQRNKAEDLTYLLEKSWDKHISYLFFVFLFLIHSSSVDK